MTLYELSQEYEQTAAMLRGRISELERALREAGDEQHRIRLDMYRDVRGVARQLNGYYRKYTPRRGAGLGPVDHRRR